jgi:hypothetical protein
VPGPSAQAEPETPSPHWPDWSVDPERALIYSPLAIDTGWANDIEAPDPDATRAEFERYMEEYRLDYLRTRHDLLVRSLVQLETAKPGRGEYKQLFTYLGLESIAMLQDIERRGHLIFNEEVILSTPEPGLSHRFVSGNSWYEVHVDEYPEFFDIQLDWATSEVPGSALPGFPDTVTRRWDPLPQHAIDQLHYRVGLAIDRFLVIWDQEGGQ